MGIKKKIFLAFSCCILLITLLSYFFLYTLFRRNYESEIMNYQQAAISMNANTVVSFLDSIRQTSLMVISDEAIGSYLSAREVAAPFDQINLRQNMISQFSHYSSNQILGQQFFLKNTLFLNDELPIASLFSSHTLKSNPYASSSNIFSNTLIRNEGWYKKLMKSGAGSYIFLEPELNSFCYAQIIRNTYYTGPYSKEGQGVMVMSLSSQDLKRTFSFAPISPNSGYALLNKDWGFLLLQNGERKLYQEAYRRYAKEKNFSRKNIRLANEKYVMSLDTINQYGLSVIFLTPYSDIQNQMNLLLRLYLLIVCLIFLVLMAAIYIMSDRFTQPIIRMAKTIRTIDDTRTFSPDVLNFSKDKEIVMLCDSFSRLIKHNNQLIQDVQEQTEQQIRYELRMLQAQISPHFIFNAMDIVSWMALSNNEDEIAEIVSSIAELMRYSIIDPDKMVSLSEELQNIREYMSIQQLRRPQKLNLHINTTEDLSSILLPKFTVQPLIENSIAHGLDSSSDEINIWMSVTKVQSLEGIEGLEKTEETDTVTVDITDDGLGCDPSKLNEYLACGKGTTLKVSNGLGIRNINDRLRLNFQGRGKLSYCYDKHHHLTAHIVLRYNTPDPQAEENDAQGNTPPGG